MRDLTPSFWSMMVRKNYVQLVNENLALYHNFGRVSLCLYTMLYQTLSDGNFLAEGKPLPGGLPPLRERQMNYRIVQGSKYARVADERASHVAAE